MTSPKIVKVDKGIISRLSGERQFAYNQDAHDTVVSMCARLTTLREFRNRHQHAIGKENEFWQEHYHQLEVIYWALKELSRVLPQ